MKIKNKGFTLIEMLIVIAIISILSSIFLVGLRGFREGRMIPEELPISKNTKLFRNLLYKI